LNVIKFVFFFALFPVSKIPEKAVFESIFLTIWHCILSGKLTKHALLQTVFLATGLAFGTVNLTHSRWALSCRCRG